MNDEHFDRIHRSNPRFVKIEGSGKITFYLDTVTNKKVSERAMNKMIAKGVSETIWGPEYDWYSHDMGCEGMII